jgi:hypothetical protein
MMPLLLLLCFYAENVTLTRLIWVPQAASPTILSKVVHTYSVEGGWRGYCHFYRTPYHYTEYRG